MLTDRPSRHATSASATSRCASTNRFRSLSLLEAEGNVHVAEPGPADPRAVEFVRFCYLRRRVGWPELYDEMCMVAARGLFRGMVYEDLAEVGVSFTLGGMIPLAQLAERVVGEERARARASGVRALPGDQPLSSDPAQLSPVAGSPAAG